MSSFLTVFSSPMFRNFPSIPLGTILGYLLLPQPLALFLISPIHPSKTLFSFSFTLSSLPFLSFVARRFEPFRLHALRPGGLVVYSPVGRHMILTELNSDFS
jgi:hypothetical protein